MAAVAAVIGGEGVTAFEDVASLGGLAEEHECGVEVFLLCVMACVPEGEPVIEGKPVVLCVFLFRVHQGLL